METKRQIKDIVKVYSKIVKTTIDPKFKFPERGKAIEQLSKFVNKFSVICGGEMNNSRMVDYCIFQAHKNQNSEWQQQLSISSFGDTAIKKYTEMSSKGKSYIEDKWLQSFDLTRSSLLSLIEKAATHPLEEYIYMKSEEVAKNRFFNSPTGYFLCSTSTLGWSPFSPTCNKCNNVDKCKEMTRETFPELYRIRLERAEHEK